MDKNEREADFDEAVREIQELERSGPPWWLVVAVFVILGPCVYFVATHPPDPPPPCRGQRIHLTNGRQDFEGCIELPRRTP